ncbi:MAG: hypothetical protein RL013_2797 [Bacteroidota bacterium]|jgi:single-strand DNA-binding protein
MINKVTLIGNLGGDPEVRHLDNGTAVGRFSLATNENYRDKDGNWQKLTEWHNIVVWRDLAERSEKLLKKGMQVYVEGKITYRKYTDKDGVERTTTDIVANVLRLLEKLEGGSDNRFPSSESAYTGSSSRSPEPASVAVNADPSPDEQLPF